MTSLTELVIIKKKLNLRQHKISIEHIRPQDISRIRRSYLQIYVMLTSLKIHG